MGSVEAQCPALQALKKIRTVPITMTRRQKMAHFHFLQHPHCLQGGKGVFRLSVQDAFSGSPSGSGVVRIMGAQAGCVPPARCGAHSAANTAAVQGWEAFFPSSPLCMLGSLCTAVILPQPELVTFSWLPLHRTL